MLYEISNTISNHKYSEWEISHKQPFKRGTQCFLVDDNPYTLYQAYKQGHSFKPHAFKDAKYATIKTIILDLDNLTKEQYEFVKSVCVGSKYSFPNVYGDESSGMKTKRHEYEKAIEGIPTPIPFTPKCWKFKVFYGVDACATYKDVYDAFLDAVCFFNPLHSRDQVKATWDLWVQADNQSLCYKHDGKDKDGVFHKAGERRANPPSLTIEDERFVGFILPDVAMMKNFRSQITYGVDVNQRKPFRELDEEDFFNSPLCKHLTMFKQPTTNKNDYEGLDWKEEFDTTPLKSEKVEPKDETISHLVKILEETIKRMEGERLDGRLYFPYGKSMMAKRLKVTQFNDLVMSSYSRIGEALWVRIRGKSRDGKVIIANLDEIWNDYYFLVQEEVRNAREYLRQAKSLGRKDTPTNEVCERMIDDIVQVLKTKYGMKCFETLKEVKDRKSKNKTMLDKLLVGIAKTIAKTSKGFDQWRLGQKIANAHFPLSDEYMKHLQSYRETRDEAHLKQYRIIRERVLKEHRDEIEAMPSEYLYNKRGLKTNLIGHAMMEKAFATMDDFVKWGVAFVARDMGVSCEDALLYEEKVRGWFKDYRVAWNKTWGGCGATIRKKDKKHSSRWSERFEGLSKDEILRVIENEVSSRQMRCYLKKQFLSTK